MQPTFFVWRWWEVGLLFRGNVDCCGVSVRGGSNHGIPLACLRWRRASVCSCVCLHRVVVRVCKQVDVRVCRFGVCFLGVVYLYLVRLYSSKSVADWFVKSPFKVGFRSV